MAAMPASSSSYVWGTGEDPASGAHEAFLTELLEVADDVADFDATADPEELREWLAPGA
jgi:hypothetical protein